MSVLIYELTKMYNKLREYSRTLALTIFIYQTNSMPQLHLILI